MTPEEVASKYDPPRTSVSLGTDLEFFFRARNHGVVPADNILPPESEAMDSDGGVKKAIFYDGIQAEIRTTPDSCRARIGDQLVDLFRTVHRVAKENGVTMLMQSSVDVTRDVLLRARDPISRQFGCSPHRSERKGGKVEQIRVDGETHEIRYAGVHVHVGSADKYALQTDDGILRTVRMLDLFLGTVGVMIESTHWDRLRRQVYGKAGIYRRKEYGLEYRTPSTVLATHPAFMSLAFSLARQAVQVVECKLDEFFLSLVPRADVIQAIDTVDKNLARMNFAAIRPYLYAIQGTPYEDEFADHGMAAFEYYASHHTDQSESMITNWHLESSVEPEHGSLSPGWQSSYLYLLRENGGRWRSFRDHWMEQRAVK
jgi:hypothetical protein